MAKSDEQTTCSWVLERLDAFVDGDLNRDEATRLETHLAACAACHAEWTLAVDVKRALGDLPEVVCPDEVVEAALARMEAVELDEARTDMTWWRRQAPVHRWALAASLLVAALIGYRAWHREETPVRTATSEVPSVANPVSPATPPAEDLSPTPEISEADIAEATRQLELTLALMGQVGRRTALAVGTEVVDSARDHSMVGALLQRPTSSNQDQESV